MTKFGPLVGAIDEGTSSARFILFRAETTTVVCSHQQELSYTTPQDGWAEQDPFDILNVVYVCIEKTIEKLIELGGSTEEIVAIGVTNQRETTIVWDRTTGKPLYNAILWLDLRTSSTVDELLKTIPEGDRDKQYLQPLCGLPLTPYFSAVKLRWLKDNVPEVASAMASNTCLFGTVDSWILWNLTGGLSGGIHITDPSNASRTMLMNISTCRWDTVLCDFFQLPKDILPEIRSSSEVYGTISNGPLKGIPLSGCLGDQQAALVGQQCFQRGQAKATFGTGCFLLYNTGEKIVGSSHGLLTTVAYQLGKDAEPIYALEGSVAIAGAAINWLRDKLNLLKNVNEIEELANSVENCGDIYFVPAFSGLYAPYWNKNARGVICGITLDTQRGHIMRATLEAVCYQVRDILDAMNRDCGIPLQRLQVDGGMTKSKLLLQLQSDVIGIDVVRPDMAEATALGVAMVAGRALNVWRMEPGIITLQSTKFSPQITPEARQTRYSKWKMAIERSLGWDISEHEHLTNGAHQTNGDHQTNGNHQTNGDHLTNGT